MVQRRPEVEGLKARVRRAEFAREGNPPAFGEDKCGLLKAGFGDDALGAVHGRLSVVSLRGSVPPFI